MDEQGIAHTTSNYTKLAINGWKHHYMDKDIRIQGLELQCNGQTGRTLLNVPELLLHHGHVYALVGRNGLGKSTLLHHIAEKRIEGIPTHFRCAYVDDDSSHKTEIERLSSMIPTSAEGSTAVEFLLQQHHERTKALSDLQKLLNDDEEVEPDALEAVCVRLAAASSDAQESKAHKILHGVGVDGSQPMKTLSGGWQHRVALAASLFVDCDVLLLDEPTNHLDIYGIAWLESEIKRQAKAGRIVVVVSHDFWFLDSVATDVLSMEAGTITPFKGNYSKMLETRQLKITQHKHAFAAQERRRRQLEGVIDRMQAKLSNGSEKGARMVKSRKQQLAHRLGQSLNNVNWKYSLMGPRPEILAPIGEEPIELPLHTDVSDIPDAAGSIETTLLQLSNAQYTYPTTSNEAAPKAVHNGRINITLTASSRIALVGRNGSGKTTLLKMLSGDLAPTRTRQDEETQEYNISYDPEGVLRWDGLRVAYVKQHAVTDLSHPTSANASLTPLEYLTATTGLKRHPAIKLLQSFLIVGKLAEENPLRSLSSGQRVRVLLATAMANEPHILLLDEPTCHLDAETSAALSEALITFEGAVVVSSHDVRFISDLNAQLFCTDPQLFGWIEANHQGDLKSFLAEDDISPYGDSEDSKKTTIELYKNRLLLWQDEETDRLQMGERPMGAAPRVGGPTAQGTALPGGIKKASSVKCRHCGGEHFSAKCPTHKSEGMRMTAPPPKPQPEKDEGAVLKFIQSEGKRRAMAETKLPSTVQKGKDGGGDWHIVVSKDTKDKMRKELLKNK